VDDEQAILDAVVLSLPEYKVDRARNGAEALEKVSITTYDLILCDLHMPEMNGIDFYRQLQVTQPHLGDRVLFMTGDSISGDTKAFLQETNTEQLHKPFTMQSLQATVKQALLESARD
jgi:CheY-like chemotaxis protein